MKPTPPNDLSSLVFAPWRLASEATQTLLQNAFLPMTSATTWGQSMSDAISLFQGNATAPTPSVFNFQPILRGSQSIEISEEVVLRKPFCQIRHFKRTNANPDDPKVLLFAPLDGHQATLFKDTLRSLLTDHDVFITTWIDAKQVPLAYGKFGLDEYINYAFEFIGALGADIHVIAVDNACPIVLTAISLLADMGDPRQPASMTLIGGAIDTQVAKTLMSEYAKKHPIEWFAKKFIRYVPPYLLGGSRAIYPGIFQLQKTGTVSIDPTMEDSFKLFQDLTRGANEDAEKNHSFYKDFLNVTDVSADVFLQMVEQFYKNNELAKGTLRWRYRLVRPDLIKRTALLVIEGDLDDVTPPGQTRAALDLCKGLPDDMKLAYLQIGVAHYGLFSGSVWRTKIHPLVQEFIRNHREAPRPDGSIALPTPSA